MSCLRIRVIGQLKPFVFLFNFTVRTVYQTFFNISFIQNAFRVDCLLISPSLHFATHPDYCSDGQSSYHCTPSNNSNKPNGECDFLAHIT